MLAKRSRAPKVRPCLLESLERRQFLSVASDGVLTSHQSPFPTGVLAETTLSDFPRIRFSYTGTYNGPQGTANIDVNITSFTHTGHFDGTLTISSTFGDLDATFSGFIKTYRRLHVIFSGTLNSVTFPGNLDALATTTGRHIDGTYSIAGAVTDSGTFHLDR
jgi:hypothetical protein